MPISAQTWQLLFVPVTRLPRFHSLNWLEDLRSHFDQLWEVSVEKTWPCDESTALLPLLKELTDWGTEEDIPRLLPLVQSVDAEMQTLAVNGILNLSTEPLPSQLLPLLGISLPEKAHYKILSRIACLFCAREWGRGPHHPQHQYWKPLLAPYLASMLHYSELSRRLQALMILACSEQTDFLPLVASMRNDRTPIHCMDWDDLINVWRMDLKPDTQWIITVRKLVIDALCLLDLGRSLQEGWLCPNDLTPSELEQVMRHAHHHPKVSPDLYRSVRPYQPPIELWQPLLTHPQACIRLKAMILKDWAMMEQGQPLPEAVWEPYLSAQNSTDFFRCQTPYPVRPCGVYQTESFEQSLKQCRDERLQDAASYLQSLEAEKLFQDQPQCKPYFFAHELPEHLRDRHVYFPFSAAFCHQLLLSSKSQLQAFGLECLAQQGWPEGLELALSWLRHEDEDLQAAAARALRFYPGEQAVEALTSYLTSLDYKAGFAEASESLRILKNPSCVRPLLNFVLEHFHDAPSAWTNIMAYWCKYPLMVLKELAYLEIEPEWVPKLLELFPGGCRWNPETKSYVDCLEELLFVWLKPKDLPFLKTIWSQRQMTVTDKFSPTQCFQHSLLEGMAHLAPREEAAFLFPHLAKHPYALNIYLERILKIQDLPNLLLLIHPGNRLFWDLAKVYLKTAPKNLPLFLKNLDKNQVWHRREKKHIQRLILATQDIF